MKKLNYSLGLVTVVLAMMFTSCGEETVNLPPIINFSNADPLVLDAGVNTTTIIGGIVSDAGLDEVKVIQITGNSELQLGAYTNFDATSIPVATTDNSTYAITLVLTDVTENITLKFEVTDKDDQFVSKSIDIIATSLFEKSDFTLNAQANGPISATVNESFLSTEDGEYYTLSEINDSAALAAKVDIMFMRHTLLKAGEPDFSLRSPDEPGISTYFTDILLDYPSSDGLKSTKLLKVSATLDWDNLNAEEFAAALDGVDGGTDRVDDLDDGDVVAFLTEEGKKGLVKVVQIVDPGDVSERYMKSNITLAYKVEL